MSISEIFATSDAVVVDLNQDYGLIAVSGADAPAFLQGQLTCDIREITPSHPGFGASCNLKGRIRALFRIFLYQDIYYLQCPSALLSSVSTILKGYARFSKITLQDVSDVWHRFGIYYPNNAYPQHAAAPQEGKMARDPLADILDPLAYQEQIEHGSLVLLTLPGTHPRFEILGPSAVAEPLFPALFQHAQMGSFAFWKLLDIQARIPEIWPETTNQFLPHSLNLPALGAVSFTKGCYCGQEVIARMEYRADLKRHMYHATCMGTAGVPAPGTPLHTHNQTQIAGTVISASQSSHHSVELLIEMLDAYVVNRDKLLITIDHQTLPLTVAH